MFYFIFSVLLLPPGPVNIKKASLMEAGYMFYGGYYEFAESMLQYKSNSVFYEDILKYFGSIDNLIYELEIRRLVDKQEQMQAELEFSREEILKLEEQLQQYHENVHRLEELHFLQHLEIGQLQEDLLIQAEAREV